MKARSQSKPGRRDGASASAFSKVKPLLGEVMRRLRTGDAAGTRSLLPELTRVIGELRRAVPQDTARRLRAEHQWHFATASVAWMQKRFTEGIPAAREALAREDGLYTTGWVLSDAAWVLVSCLADAGERQEALTLTRALLADRARLRARVAKARVRTELLFVAMLGNFSDDPNHDVDLYREVYTAVVASLRGEPRTGNLWWAFAAYEAEHGDRGLALRQLTRALSALPHLRGPTGKERCFERLRGDASFRRLVGTRTPASSVTKDPFVAQFEDTVARLFEARPSLAARCMAELLVAVNAGMAPVPDALREWAYGAAEERKALGDAAYWQKARRSGIASFCAKLWLALGQARCLFAGRAEPLAAVLARAAASAAEPLQVLQTSVERGWKEPAQILRRSIRAYRGEAFDPAMRIDLEFVQEMPKHVELEWYPSGHLKSAAGRGGGAKLELEETPGRGRFGETGKAGGYGFLTSERYFMGAVRGTLNSPWHDGEDYREKMPWVLWVAQRLQTLRSSKPPRSRADRKAVRSVWTARP